VTILAGQTTATITIPTLDDNLVEATETVIATLTSIAGANKQRYVERDAASLTATANITDNDSGHGVDCQDHGRQRDGAGERRVP